MTIIVFGGAFACATSPVRPAVRSEDLPIARLDHVMFLGSCHSALIALLADTLRLPLVWPTPGGAQSGSSGISFGNVVLEVMHRRVDEPVLGSLALQARDWASVDSQLRRRGVDTREPAPGPIDSAKPGAGPRWTLQSLRGLGRGVFVVQYHHFDMDARRAESARQLHIRRGGALGVVPVREVVVVAESLATRASAWTRLFGKASKNETSWSVGDGPRITMVDEDHAQRNVLVVEVESLASASRALHSLRVKSEGTPEGLRIEEGRLCGLRMLLVPGASHPPNTT